MLRMESAGKEIHMIELESRNVNIQIGEYELVIQELNQYNEPSCDVILGLDFLSQYYPLHLIEKAIILTTPCKHEAWGIRITNPYRRKDEKFQKKYNENEVQFLENNKPIEINNMLSTLVIREVESEEIIRLNIIEGKMKKEIEQRLIENYSENPLIHWEKSKPLAKIELKDYSREINCKPYPWTEQDKKEFEMHINEMKKYDLIRESKSEYSSPAMIVIKHSEEKRGKSRMVINYKKLNDLAVRNRYPIPKIELLFNLIRGKNIFSKFDCKSGFFQIKLEEESKKYTAFSTSEGLYEWNVLPMGFHNSPSIFQEYVTKLLLPIRNFAVIYIDDILIFSENEQIHEEHLEKFIELIENRGLNISPNKAELRKNRIGFLGQYISPEGIELQEHISKKVLEFSEIRNKKELQSFLGLVNQARSYIPNLSRLTAKISRLAGEKSIWIWNDQTKKIIEQIKKLCQNLPKLIIPTNNNVKWIIYTDASENYWGAALYHENNEGKETITKYSSGKFNDSQSRYHSNWKEFLAIVKAVEKFELFIVNTKFVIKTDNTQVKHWLDKGIKTNKLSNKMLIKWQSDMAYYDYGIEYIKGQNNLIADFLSRWNQEDQ